MQYDYRYSVIVLQVTTGVEFDCKAATQGATSRYTSNFTNAQPYKGYWAQTLVHRHHAQRCYQYSMPSFLLKRTSCQ